MGVLSGGELSGGNLPVTREPAGCVVAEGAVAYCSEEFRMADCIKSFR